uniref:Uncharacterized protein n=1 Tax=Lophosiphonia teges TaxID=2007110 RepID=A0A1Z1MVF7_9FLOR|nr:hypothetical protein [Polysiphonia teges]
MTNYKKDNINSGRINPIGQFFIENKVDINKNLYELYFCYCKDLEKKLSFNNPFWGRKYLLHQNNNSYIMIQEFFSPKIILFSTNSLKTNK